MLKQEGNKAQSNIPKFPSQHSNNTKDLNYQSDSISQASSAPTSSHSTKFNLQESTPKGANEGGTKVKINQDSKKRLSEFLDKFQGKVSMISKDGHLGVVARTGKPIDKGEFQKLQQQQEGKQHQVEITENKQQSYPDVQNQSEQASKSEEGTKGIKQRKSQFFKQKKEKLVQEEQITKQAKDNKSKQSYQSRYTEQLNQQQTQVQPPADQKQTSKPPIYQPLAQINSQNNPSQPQLEFSHNNPLNNTYSINPMMPRLIQQPYYQEYPVYQQNSNQYQYQLPPDPHQFYMQSQRPYPQQQTMSLTNFHTNPAPVQQPIHTHYHHQSQMQPMQTFQGPQFSRSYRSNSIAPSNEPPPFSMYHSQVNGGQQSMKNILSYQPFESNNQNGYGTPKSQFTTSKSSQFNFNSIGSQIMRKTEYNVISNKRVFSQSRGIGPANIGTDEWVKAKEKQDRMQSFLRQLKREEQRQTSSNNH